MRETDNVSVLKTGQQINQSTRKHWMGILARAGQDQLETCWQQYGKDETYDVIRAPEQGLVMVQGRAGGTGQRFNLGEMTVTRCSVKLTSGTIGHAYIKGRNKRHAELAAAFDALLQNQKSTHTLLKNVIDPIANDYQTNRDLRSRKAAATKVDFFTMVRGENN